LGENHTGSNALNGAVIASPSRPSNILKTKRTKMPHKKPDLPTKLCPVCQRPFVWRKKWERCWDQVRYCSEKCRKAKESG